MRREQPFRVPGGPARARCRSAAAPRWRCSCVRQRVRWKAGDGCGASERFVYPENLRGPASRSAAALRWRSSRVQRRGLVCRSAAVPRWRCSRVRRRARWKAGDGRGARKRFVYPEDLREPASRSVAALRWRSSRVRRRGRRGPPAAKARREAGSGGGAGRCGYPNTFAARVPCMPRSRGPPAVKQAAAAKDDPNSGPRDT